VVDSDLELPGGQPETARTFRNILCLSGGGYRGLFTAIVLEHIEARLQAIGVASLRDHFDLVAGTSIGGLLACGIACGVPAAKLQAALREHGPKVFPAKRFQFLRKLFGPLYSTPPLVNAVKASLGGAEAQTLDKVQTPLLVPAVSWISGAVTLFASRGLVGAAAKPITLLDVCLSTSAAPTYFPPNTIPNVDVLVDGGLAANAPDLAALAAATELWRLPLQSYQVVSIGTAGSAAGGMAASVPRSGIRWAQGAQIVQLVLAAQERHTVASCKTLLGDRFFRIDQPPTQHHLALQALDKVDASVTTTLSNLAAQAIAAARVHPPAWAQPLVQ